MATVVAVCKDEQHNFSKVVCESIHLLEGRGVEGDAHCGELVKHQKRVKRQPEESNLRQVHLIHAELLEELRGKDFDVHPGSLGENILTEGVDIITLPKGTILRFGAGAAVELTGLRTTCDQLDKFQRGLVKALIERPEPGGFKLKAGVLSRVIRGGTIKGGDEIVVELPEEPHQALDPI